MDARNAARRLSSVLIAVSSLLFIVLAPAPAHAGDPSPELLAKITKLNKKGVEAYQRQDYDAARGFLKEALDACNANGLENHAIKARTEIHVGIVLIAGYKQREAGIKHFQKALQIQPDIQLTKSLVTPELQDAFEESMVGGGGGAATPSKSSGGGDDDDSRPSRASTGGGDDDSGGAGAGAGSGDDDEDHPQRKKAPPKKKKPKKRDDDEDGGGGDDDGGGSHASGNNAGKIFLGLTLGSGFGIATGKGEEGSVASHSLKAPGLALAQAVHFAPEVGYHLSSSFLVSLQVRFQIITGVNPGPTTCGANPCTPHSNALAVFARATYILDGDSFHFFVGGSLGGGSIRHVFNFPADGSCQPKPGSTSCVDTLGSGPIFIGPNAGVMYDLTPSLSLIASVNTQLGLPTFTYNIDGNVGAGLRF
jgi:hypothetical protein